MMLMPLGTDYWKLFIVTSNEYCQLEDTVSMGIAIDILNSLSFYNQQLCYELATNSTNFSYHDVFLIYVVLFN